MITGIAKVPESAASRSNHKAPQLVSLVEVESNTSSDTESERVLESTVSSVNSVPSHLGDDQHQCKNSRARCTLAAFSLRGKVCVVTAGASGIGLAICEGILESGGAVAIVDFNASAAEEKAKHLIETYEQENIKNVTPLVSVHVADVASPTSIDLVITSILNKHGRIDNLVTSASICEYIPAVVYPPSRLQKLWSVNVDGSFYFATAVARHLMQRKADGSIVFIGSMSSSIVNVPQL